MEDAKINLWRIEFDTDLTMAGSLIIPLGFLLEARWPQRARAQGMVFRRRIMPLELDRVNLSTWPELGEVEKFMKTLFAQAWDNGTENVAGGFTARSALHFSRQSTAIELGAFDRVHSAPRVLEQLLAMSDQLAPNIAAPVVKLPSRKVPSIPAAAVHEDVHTLAEAA
jgi:hypothetical protein